MSGRRARRTLLMGVIGLSIGGVLAACGNGSSAVPSGGGGGGSGPAANSAKGSGKSLVESKNAHGSITIWQQSSDGAPAYVASFEKAYPNIKVKVVNSATSTNDAAMVSAAAGHKLPDVTRSADVDTYYFSSHGLFLDLSPYMKAYGFKPSQYISGIMQLGQYKGGQYVIPRGFDEAVTAYNPKVLKLFHLPIPKEGMTWAEFQKDACAINGKKVDGKTYYGVGTNLTNTSYILYDAFMASTGGSAMNAAQTKATFDSPKSLKGLTELTNFSRKCSSWMDNFPKSNDPFTSGHAAFDVVVPDQVLTWPNAKGTAWSTVNFPVNIVNFPLLSPFPKDGAGMIGLAATVDSKSQKAAAAFEMWMLSPQGETAASKSEGWIPLANNLKSKDSWAAKYAFTKKAYGYTFNAPAFDSYTQDIVTPPAKLQVGSDGTSATAITDAWTAVQLKKQTVTQAFTKADGTINSWLQSQGS